MHLPDSWTVIKIDSDDPHYRVLAGWSGGYLDGDSWALNSGIVRVEEGEDCWNFYGKSGSCYSCRKQSYGLRNSTLGVWASLQEKHGDVVSIMDEDTDWINMDWIIK